MLPRMREIVVIRAGALGDSLLALPALAALRTRWPAATLTLVASRVLLPFAAAAGFADQLFPFEGEAGLSLLSPTGPLPPWAGAELAIVWLRQWEEVRRRLTSGGAGYVLGAPSLPADDQPGHVGDHLLETLAPLGIGPCRLARPLALPPGAAERADHWLQQQFPGDQPIIAIHPGSGGPRKCWPAARFAALVARLLTSGLRVLLCLGPAEADARQTWWDVASGQPGLTVLEGADLSLLAALLRRCAAFVGNDAGVTHLAAALGLPTLALFGPTAPERWAPLGPHVRVLRDLAWQAPSDGAPVWSLREAQVRAALHDLLSRYSGSSKW